MADVIWLVIALPLAGFVTLLFFGKRIGEPNAGYLATATVVASFLLAVVASLDFVQGGAEETRSFAFDWIPALGVEVSFLWDPLAAMMTLVVTGVGALIHLYSIGYMHGDHQFGRFFTYLNLFITSMLILVLADNFAVLFIGWELVGLSSYLLISFWFVRPTAAAAGKKAFIINRIGDFGFLIALMLIFHSFGSFAYETVFEDAGRVLSTGEATAIGLLLLVGAAGKSAQLPLYVWLPDAMEGPTPVSALIHAATMVTAGVYMVARTGAIYELAPIAAGIVATIGAITALYAATIAIGQRDIKRVLAYSTISQLGYMFMAVGAAAYVAGVFHLMTHAFFKALLFLGAGSVIHAMKDEQDMWKMGGLRKRMPITFATMVVAWLAISGIPPLSGFWSKDEILAVTFERGGAWVILWAVGIITAGLTAFYMSRLIFLTFWGEPRWDEALKQEGAGPQESPATMTVPLMALAVAAAVGGLFNTPFVEGIGHFLDPSFERFHVALAHAPSGITPWLLAVVSVAAGVFGIWFAYRRYVEEKLPVETGAVWDRLEHGYYVDDLYGTTLVKPGRRAAVWTAFVADAKGVDGAVNGIAVIIRSIGNALRPLQTGYVRSYAVGIGAGTVGLLVWFLFRGGGF